MEMDIIILKDGLYHLILVAENITIDCFDLCDILRLHLTTYYEPWNVHVMKDGTGHLYGCICK